jgi:hypothetical protein
VVFVVSIMVVTTRLCATLPFHLVEEDPLVAVHQPRRSLPSNAD